MKFHLPLLQPQPYDLFGYRKFTLLSFMTIILVCVFVLPSPSSIWKLTIKFGTKSIVKKKTERSFEPLEHLVHRVISPTSGSSGPSAEPEEVYLSCIYPLCWHEQASWLVAVLGSVHAVRNSLIACLVFVANRPHKDGGSVFFGSTISPVRFIY